MSLDDCKARCVGTPGCTGVTTLLASAVPSVPGAGGSLFECFRKADVMIAECDMGSEYSTSFMKITM
jgi:hypothetical protein